jgi:hypothetical protein
MSLSNDHFNININEIEEGELSETNINNQEILKLIVYIIKFHIHLTFPRKIKERRSTRKLNKTQFFKQKVVRFNNNNKI